MTKRFSRLFVWFVLALAYFCSGDLSVLGQPPPGFIEQTPIFPLSEIKSGLKGFGLSDFGNGPEKFEFEVLGLVPTDLGFSRIEVRLFGGPSDYKGANILSESGVIAGMSGSPLFTNSGEIIGAIAFARALNKEAIGSAVPIEYIYNWKPKLLSDRDYVNKFFSDLSTPSELAVRKPVVVLPPGSSYVTALVWGDDVVAASIATITAVSEQGFFYAQGHPSFNLGVTGLPVFPATIFGVNPNLGFSSKIGTADLNQSVLGTIFFDGMFGHLGIFGKEPKSFPLRITVNGVMPRTLVFNSRIAVLPPELMIRAIGSILFERAGLFDPSLDIYLKSRILIDGLPEILINENISSGGFLGIEAFARITENLIDKNVSFNFNLEASNRIEEAQVVQLDISLPVKNQNHVFAKVGLESAGENKHWEQTVRVPYDKSLKGGMLHASDGKTAIGLVTRLVPGSEKDYIKAISEFSDTDMLYIYILNKEEEAIGSENLNRNEVKGKWETKEVPARLIFVAKIKPPEEGYRVSGVLMRKLRELPELSGGNENIKEKAKKKPWYKKIWIF